MKTIVALSKSLAKFLALPLLMAALFVGCGKSNDNSVNNNPAYNNINGTCVNTQNNTPVQSYLCSSTGYTYSNNTCFSTTTQQPVPLTFCSGSTSGYSSQACYGTYIYQGYQVTCNGQNCRGVTGLYTQNGQQAVCQ